MATVLNVVVNVVGKSTSCMLVNIESVYEKLHFKAPSFSLKFQLSL
ncbi:hypothetical protein D088_290009 [Salmonella enterica subsp. houtenae serovar 16:z4,z32:-- str. RKS3027]|nr:hypothetical protein D088_290009 [Salmonella enterica subsp. houtenae serovar 16:z4,z32:-- str. RKS3027]